MTRRADVERTTKETSVHVALAVDGSGTASADTGVPFFDHMLQQLGTHAGFDLDVTAKGDLEVDAHHTVEDFVRAFATSGGITLHVRLVSGRAPHHVVEAEFKALARALGDACALTGRGGAPSTKGVL